jgi:penicillin amidase
MRLFKKIFVFVLALIVVACLGIFAYLQNLKPNLDKELRLPGLKDKVEVLYDEYGIPHIYAQNEEDLFHAFGYVHAQDRLFQMEALRRLADGRLAEVFGEKALASDKYFRTLSFREHAQYTLKTQYADTTTPFIKAAKAYLNGVNQYIATGKTPIEFTLASIPKTPFTLEDLGIIAGYMGYTFVATFKTEPIATLVYDKLGEKYYQDVLRQWPDSAFKIPVQGKEDFRTDSATKVLGMMQAQLDLITQQQPYPPFLGSNGWVIAGSKTKSGKPILSNDTHMGFAQPSVWYEAHLECPGFNIYGNFVAGTPFPALGHNQYGGWGLTMFENDDADFYKERKNPENKNQVWYKDHWEDLLIRKETIKVKGGADEILEVKKSRHGYLLNGAFTDIDEGSDPIALWWVFYQFPARHLEVFYNLSHAKDVNEAGRSVEPLTAPGLNFMWGDTKGNIAWWAAGKLPIRPAHVDPQRILDGASGNDEVLGWLPFAGNPQIVNPARGVLYSANNQPADMGTGLVPGYYVPSDRAARIEELLFNDKKDWNEESLRKIINDVQSTTYARNLQQVLPVVDKNKLNPPARPAYEALLKWDGKHELENIEPTIYYRFIYEIIVNSFQDELGQKEMQKLQASVSLKRNLESFLLNDSSAWWDNVNTRDKESRSAILTSSLNKAVEFLKKDLGDDMKEWKWARVHTLEHKHPLGIIPVVGRFFNVGPIAVNGGRETINNLNFGLDSTGRYKVTSGPALRRIIDFADPTLGYSVNPTGQSGYFMSSHYADQANMYAEGGRRPELMNRKSIEKVLKGKTVLKP